ncbi:MAG: tRNA-dependent cyclodipeptide synthase [Patescibacteria group bacterium]
MTLHQIRGGTSKALKQKEYNIAIGISLGNKWFTPENIFDLTLWSLDNTKDFVVVYVADLIHAINIEVRDGVSIVKAEKKAKKMGKKMMEDVKQILSEKIEPEVAKKIYLATWADFINEDYLAKMDYLYNLYGNDQEFQEVILNIVEDFVSKEERTFTVEDKRRFGTYIIEEMPEMLTKLPVGDLVYDANAYPFDSLIAKLCEDIQTGKAFPQIKADIIDQGNRVFLEVR